MSRQWSAAATTAAIAVATTKATGATSGDVCSEDVLTRQDLRGEGRSDQNAP
jgi:hypothetical protein